MFSPQMTIQPNLNRHLSHLKIDDSTKFPAYYVLQNQIKTCGINDFQAAAILSFYYYKIPTQIVNDYFTRSSSNQN